MSILTTTFVLTGALRGKTVKLGSQGFQFVNGKMVYQGSTNDTALVGRFIERNWQAFPEGHERVLADVKAAQEKANGQRNLQKDPLKDKQSPVPGDLQPGGEGSEAGDPAPDGEEPAGAEGGDAGGIPDGDGHEESLTKDEDPEQDQSPAEDAKQEGPELNEKLQRAILALDSENDQHWTKDGKPAMTAVEGIYGSTAITRAQVEAAYPGYNRSVAAQGK